VWQTTSTPDTYYSCSDLTIKPAPASHRAAAAPVQKATRKPAPAVTRSSTPARARTAPTAADQAAGPAAGTSALSPVSASSDWRADLGREIVAGALLVIAGVAAGTAVRRIRRRRGIR
jgi:hypothetical protein